MSDKAFLGSGRKPLGMERERETGRSGTAVSRRAPRATQGGQHRRHKQQGGRILLALLPQPEKPGATRQTGTPRAHTDRAGTGTSFPGPCEKRQQKRDSTGASAPGTARGWELEMETLTRFHCEDKEGICKGVLPAGEPAGARDSLSAVPPEALFYRNQLEVQYPPLCKEIFCFISFTVPVFPIQGLESTTAVESRALEENLFLRRAGSPALIYNTSQHPPFLLLSHLLPPLHFTSTTLQESPTPNATEEV